MCKLLTVAFDSHCTFDNKPESYYILSSSSCTRSFASRYSSEQLPCTHRNLIQILRNIWYFSWRKNANKIICRIL